MATTYYHVCIGVDALERAVIDNTYDDLFLLIDDRPAKREELIEAINSARSKGYDVIPPCDNVKSTGHCAGHPSTEGLK